MTELKTRILDDVKAAMKAQDKDRLGVLRMLTAAIKQREVDERVMLDETQVIVVIEKMIKQRKESISQFQTANRQDLADKENAEMQILAEYLPEPLSDAEIDALITAAMKATEAVSIKDMGKVINKLREQAQGRADMAMISQKVKEKLS